MTAVRESLIWEALQDVKDPEIPVLSVVEMGIVTAVEVDGGRVTVRATPTFVGCPALELMRQAMIRRLADVPGVESVEVTWHLNPHWTSARITALGRQKLARFGIAPPPGGAGTGAPDRSTLLADVEPSPACPFCGSRDTHIENVFGPTACRSIYYCRSCRNPFEAMKAV